MDLRSDRLAIWLGLGRVLAPANALPQAADRLDSTPVCGPFEALLDVDRLVLDATSMGQLRNQLGSDGVADGIAAIVRRAGKMHNPVTGSGGIASGILREVGRARRPDPMISPGRRVVSLASLTLLPLDLQHIDAVADGTTQVTVRGTAVLAPSVPVAGVPDDLALDIALAALDVAGAPAHVGALASRGGSVVIIGAGGTAGLLSLAAARAAVGPDGCVLAVEACARAAADADALGYSNEVIQSNAQDPISVATSVGRWLPRGADLAVSVVNAPGCEASAFLCAHDQGTVLFFSMATSFTAAALGAEGIASSARMLIGSGYSRDRGQTALGLLRDQPRLRELFAARHTGD